MNLSEAKCGKSYTLLVLSNEAVIGE